MLIAHVTFAVDEIHREHVLNRLAKDATTVRSMDGCVAFIPFADPTHPQKIGVLHEWRSREDFAGYTSSETFAKFRADVLPMAIAPPVSRRFDASLLKPAD